MAAEGGTHAADGPEPPSGMTELVAVMDRLRSPGGCPWDAEQTHASLLPHAVEEVYEVVDAVEHGDRDDLREELGDLLLQVVFHARIAQEHPSEPFDLDDVAAGVAAKLVRRHPHVFTGTGATGADVTGTADVHRRWEEAKEAEKARASVLDGVPAALPALARAQKVVSRTRRAGLPTGVSSEPVTVGVGADHGRGPDGPSVEARLADALLALVGAAEAAGVDAESALRRRVREIEARARQVEAERRADGSQEGAG